MTTSHRDQDKARRYISLLDTARCNGNWQEVPELVRKVSKHAPQRKCLILVAQSEHEIVSYSSKRPLTSSSTSTKSLSQLIPPLLTAIEHENTLTEDAFQAQVCLGWVHWALNEPGLAISRLPKDHGRIFLAFADDGREPSGWTRVCAIKGAFIRGASQEKVSGTREALETFRSILELLPSTSASNLSPEQRLWTERLLARFCVLTSQISPGSWTPRGTSITSLTAFRAWATFWEGRPSQGLTALDGPSVESGILRRHIWKAYYDTLSFILQQGLSYEPPLAAITEKSGPPAATRIIQRIELKRVETTYEGLMLKEMRFPKADEVNEEVEDWVEQVMRNWRVFCGPSWHDEEPGEGGQDAVGRSVLDILYRAATKTFHSTAVLRHLFTVHTSLAEFDIAFNAFDTYLVIVTKGKARAEKSGNPGGNLDNDETLLRTAAEGINILCRFGAQQEAEKARDIGEVLSQWLHQYILDPPLQPTPNGQDSAMVLRAETMRRPVIPPTSLAIAHRAIGISQARWAEMTFEAAARAEFQAKAQQNLYKSLSPDLEDSTNVKTLFAQGMLLAKTRDLSSAIRVVKLALSEKSRESPGMSPPGTLTGTQPSIGVMSENTTLLRKRKLIPLWHLLALLMSARQEWATAMRSCAAAFEQFSDTSYLFGSEEGPASKDLYQGDTTGSRQDRSSDASNKGAVDDMDTFEKQGIIEIKMTQLALMEVLEGTEVAVNATDELLTLFRRLFRDLDVFVLRNPQSEAMPAPKSSSGTVKSTRASLFGRAKALRRSEHETDNSMSSTGHSGTTTSTVIRHSSEAAAAPRIQVTNEDGNEPKLEHQHHHRLHRHEASHSGQRLQKRSASLNSRRSFGSFRKKGGSSSTTSATIPGLDQTNVPGVIEESRVGPIDDEVFTEERQRAINPAAVSTHPNTVGIAMSQNLLPPAPSPAEGHDESPKATQPLSNIANNFHHRQKPPASAQTQQTPNQDVRLPTVSPQNSTTQPGPHFPKAREQRHAKTLLVKIWLLIAGLYRRAGMHDDARGACDEAFTHVESIEAHVAAQTPSSSRAFEERGWGCCKSVEELWADVWTERGNLSQAQAAPKEALEYYERALSHCLDYPAATVALSNILLDVYTQTTPPQSAMSTVTPNPTSDPRLSSPLPNSTPFPLDTNNPQPFPNASSPSPHSPPPSPDHGKTPSDLSRLAARDRAYGLLSSLTKLGTGWDNSEAWFALARAYEEGGQIEKAKEVLWWCVELEDTRPVREWDCVGVGGYVLC